MLGKVKEFVPTPKAVVKVGLSLVAIATVVGVAAMFAPRVANAARSAMSNGLTGLLPKQGQ